jgi:hypothetical protein
MRVRIDSQIRHPLLVRRVRTAVRRGAPGCSRRNVRVRRYRGHLWIGPLGTRYVRVRVAMRRHAPDACQGTRFKLRFHARATRQ